MYSIAKAGPSNWRNYRWSNSNVVSASSGILAQKVPLSADDMHNIAPQYRNDCACFDYLWAGKLSKTALGWCLTRGVSAQPYPDWAFLAFPLDHG